MRPPGCWILKPLKLFEALNRELRSEDVLGEIGICGGAVMCLVFNARESTKDVDAIFKPAREIREASKRLAEKLGTSDEWLNEAAKGFSLARPPVHDVVELSNNEAWRDLSPKPQFHPGSQNLQLDHSESFLQTSL